MKIRLVDYRCRFCHKEWEEMEFDGQRKAAKHCGGAAQRIIKSPAMFGVKKYQHIVGQPEVTTRELDRQLAKSGDYIPTAYEAKQVKDMMEAGVEPVLIKPKPNAEQIKRHVEKAAARLAADGLKLET